MSRASLRPASIRLASRDSQARGATHLYCPDSNPFLAVALQAAQAAAAIHRFHAADSDKQVDTKANYADIVTKVDKLSEERIREVISAAYPSYSVLGEEEGE